MKELRIVFMGTPEFAVASLDKLLENKLKVVGVITAMDKPAGRGRKIHQSAVKKYALEKELKVLQPPNLKDEAFLKELKDLNANLQVVVAFRMLPRQVWAMPAYGTLNLHASLLPDYRGAAPINWAIMKGETKTGVTTFFIDDKIDTGAIILQEATSIGPHETAGDLHDRLMSLGSDLVLKTVRLIQDGEVTTQSQKEKTSKKEAPKIHKDSCRINWAQPLLQIYNHIRGLSPYPTAWSVLLNGHEEVPIKVYKARPEKAGHHLDHGTLVTTKNSMKVAVPGGFMDLLEVQLAGKRKLEVGELLNGLILDKNARLS